MLKTRLKKSFKMLIKTKSEKGAAAIEKFFYPKSVAIIGASRDPRKFGHTILRNFREDFKGPIYPINPKAEEILGLRCYPSVKEIYGKVDLAVVVVPAEAANGAVEECVEKGIPAVVVITAGYREIGGEGIAREKELENIIQKAKGKTRVIGPNVLGIYDPYGNVDTLFLPDYKLKRPAAGSIAFISQSGAFGSAIIDWAATEGIGISRFVSYGNAVDIDEIELLKYLADDEQTKAILCYIEGVKNGRKFLETLKEATRKKPVIIFKAGKSETGAKAAMSHTGSLAGKYEIFRAAIKQGGAIEARTVEQMFDFARALAYQPKAKGPNVGIITNGGGFGVICADVCTQTCLQLASFSKETMEKLKPIMPAYSTTHNPLDLIGDADAKRYEAALNALMDDKNVDCIICVVLMQTTTLEPDVVEVISNAKEKSTKPILIVSAGGEYTQLLLKSLEKEGIPAYPTPERAAKAMAVLVEK